MPKVTTEYACPSNREERDLVKFKYDINVNSKGLFNTTLPADAVEQLESMGIDFDRNYIRRNTRKGYIEAATMGQLKDAVKQIVDKAVSREMISERLVIQYGVSTNCHYVKHKDGGIYPNGYHCPDGVDNVQARWVDGMQGHGFSDGAPYSLEVYARPFIERVYRYNNGNTKTMLSYINESSTDSADHLKPGPNLLWLNSVVRISPKGLALQTVEYTEPVALFFVTFIKTIMSFSDKIKGMMHPEGVKSISQSSVSGFIE